MCLNRNLDSLVLLIAATRVASTVFVMLRLGSANRSRLMSCCALPEHGTSGRCQSWRKEKGCVPFCPLLLLSWSLQCFFTLMVAVGSSNYHLLGTSFILLLKYHLGSASSSEVLVPFPWAPPLNLYFPITKLLPNDELLLQFPLSFQFSATNSSINSLYQIFFC
jgi:hypothetical protein